LERAAKEAEENGADGFRKRVPMVEKVFPMIGRHGSGLAIQKKPTNHEE